MSVSRQEYERAVLFRLGRVRSGGPVGPGLFFIIPCIDAIVVTDLRTISFDVPPQEILTKDSVTVAVDAVVYYKINNPLSAVCNVTDYAKSTKLLSSTTLRTALGTKNLSEILSDRESIAMDILEQLDSATNPWGIRVSEPSRMFIQSSIMHNPTTRVLQQRNFSNFILSIR